MKKLRVGFLVDDLSPSRQVNELIEFVHENSCFDDPVLITGYKKTVHASARKKMLKKLNQEPLNFLNAMLKVFLFKAISRVELPYAQKHYPGYILSEKIENVDDYNVVHVDGEWSKSGLYLDMTEEDLSIIDSCELDCIVRCGTGILKGRILDITRFGVISFHHGDNRTNRGGPSGFWEVFHGEPSSGFVIQKLTPELDGGDVLVRGNVMTANVWLANNAQLLAKSNIFMMQLLVNIAENNKLPSLEGVRLHGFGLYKLDSSLVLMQYILKVIVPKAMSSLISKFRSPKKTRWSVAYCYHDDFRQSLWRYKDIKNPKGRLLADPFVVENNGDNFIFVEDLFFHDHKGRISVLKVDRDDYEFMGVVLEEDFHLSYPFVFKDGGDIYMIPETSQNSDIRLYKSIEFPLRWEFEKQLMTDVGAADTMVFKIDNLWFMLTNICSANVKDYQSELHIFYSEDFKSDEWKPIETGNPVIFDPLRGRNGGFFRHNGKLYRVNQVHGQAHYGKNFRVNEIEVLTKEKYAEKEVSIVQPNFKKSTVSTHHFSANEKVAAVDFARMERLRKALRT
ncbi:MAG: hypothetical protein AB8B84_11975 [Granulosicoccus sp.]